MDGRDGELIAASSAYVKPLHLRKASSNTHFAPIQTTFTKNYFTQSAPGNPVFPPRSSSIPNQMTHCDQSIAALDATRNQTPSPLSSPNDSLIADEGSGYYHSTTISPEGPILSSNTSRHLYPDIVTETVLYNSSRLISSAIMGDFVPIDSPNMAGLQPEMDSRDDRLQGTFKPFRAIKKNPYEFEPSTPYHDPSRQTTFTEFVEKSQQAPSPRSAHTKNALSEENVKCFIRAPTHLAETPTKANGYPLQRSESSPNVSQLPFPTHRDVTSGSEILDYYTEARQAYPPAPRGRQDLQQNVLRGDKKSGVMYQSQSPCRREQEHAQQRPSRSPLRHTPHAAPVKGHAIDRSMTRSPTKVLDDVLERDEYNDIILDTTPSSSPKKRSRSPMKKMFGENGWLGKSPDEKPDLKPSKNPFSTHMDFAHRPKKLGMMEKLRHKFDEIADKADLGPPGRTRSNSDKHKQAVLTISLGPPEQARIYMEIELMLVHTANSFLMTQFSQGRMDIDTIKKTVESWKGKGRPVVIEFMYDQATQRDVVVANQHSFRFHGDNAGSDIRINSMLYNWKQVAQLMLIRTFCNADTVILKLLFDIEQILELLGAVDPMMIRLQQIRATATEMMRISRQSKDSKANSQRSVRGREPPRNSGSSVNISHHSMEDTYGGMKLVPENYKE